MHCVVGSGPSGVACAQALLQKGLTVRMLDAGLTLEPARARAVEKLGVSAPADWDPQLLALLKENMTSTAKGIPQKLVYGSDFPYRATERHVPCTFEGVGLRPSLALGGLSNVWGSAMMPYLDSDLAGWPIKSAQLSEHYAAVLQMTGLSGRKDDLAIRFPLHTDDPGNLDLSRQARTLLSRMERNKAALNRNGIEFGAARVAIRAKRAPDQPGCVYCGMCMYGCPYGYIYNSASTLEELKRHERFTYQPDTVVTSFSESGSDVTIRAHERVTGKTLELRAVRLYLAAGVIPTTRMVLESNNAYDQTVWMKDSQYFLIPLLLSRRARNVPQEALHTLSQLFLEIFDPEISPYAVHLQVYSYSELIGQAIRQSLARFGLNFDFAARQLEERMLVVQGFLHSDQSSKIATTLRRDAAGRSHLELKAELNPAVKSTVRKVTGKLMRQAAKLGALPVPPMVEIAEPGRSYHSGGTFPMRQEPGVFESDTLGRPHGWRRVHAVDAAVLPGIPATTITLSVMANAHRIASESAALM